MTPEDIRFEVRRHLYGRPTANVDVDTLQHGLRRSGVEADKPEITAALVFLSGLTPPQVVGAPSSLGGTMRWQITSAGILAYERNQ